MSYETAPDNAGLSSSYNRALQMAAAAHYDWLLTLDQDTELPEDYFRRIAEHCRSLTSRLDVAAITPQVIECAACCLRSRLPRACCLIGLLAVLSVQMTAPLMLLTRLPSYGYRRSMT